MYGPEKTLTSIYEDSYETMAKKIDELAKKLEELNANLNAKGWTVTQQYTKEGTLQILATKAKSKA
jgi:prefoldin subunit 5